MSTPPPTMLTPRRRGAIRGAFTLTELLVSISIVLVLMTLAAGAVSAARGSQRRQGTATLIARLDAIVMEHYASLGSRSLSLNSTAATRARDLRRLASAELPDNWPDVAAIATNPTSPAQRAYAAFWNSLPTARRTTGASYVGNLFGDAECLFMIVMMGGITDCLDCGSLGTSQIGDQDGDGVPEFLDDWGNPIRYVLWPAGLELPPGTGSFFFVDPFSGMSDPRAMRPLIVSAGPDKILGLQTNGVGSLAFGNLCGTIQASTAFGALDPASLDGRLDNVTNLDREARK